MKSTYTARQHISNESKRAVFTADDQIDDTCAALVVQPSCLTDDSLYVTIACSGGWAGMRLSDADADALVKYLLAYLSPKRET